MRRDVRRSPRRATSRTFMRLVWLAAVLIGCGAPEQTSVKTNVVLIGIDTLRADHLGCYGYPRPTSPHIDALAAEGVVFERAISQAPWTLPSFASMMTGLRPGRHGAGEGKQCLQNPCNALVATVPTLAELFTRAGWRTGSFVSNAFAGATVGLGRGFETAQQALAGSDAAADATTWIEAYRDEPFFAFIHIVDPHAPYAPDPADAAPFLDPAYVGPVGPMTAHVPKPDWTAADRQQVVDLYDGEVHSADRWTGGILEALRRLGLDGRTLVVLVSDHGEELFERGTLGHGHTLYDELVHVPLIIRFPGGTPRGRVAHQVRAMDLFSTVLDVTGIPSPPARDAVSLVGMAGGRTAPAATSGAISEFMWKGPAMRALRRPNEKVIVDVDRDTMQLFDLRADPGERTDVAGRRGREAVALKQKLARTDTRSVAGFHLVARGGFVPHRLRVKLRAGGPGFSSFTPIAREDGDVVELSADRHTVTFDVLLESGDSDGVRLAEPNFPNAPLTLLSATLDGQPLGTDRLQVGPTRLSPGIALPFDVTFVQATVPRADLPQPLDGGVRVAILAVPPSTRATLVIDPTTRERLNALGYAE